MPFMCHSQWSHLISANRMLFIFPPDLLVPTSAIRSFFAFIVCVLPCPAALNTASDGLPPVSWVINGWRKGRAGVWWTGCLCDGEEPRGRGTSVPIPVHLHLASALLFGVFCPPLSPPQIPKTKQRLCLDIGQKPPFLPALEIC